MNSEKQSRAGAAPRAMSGEVLGVTVMAHEQSREATPRYRPIQSHAVILP